MPNKKKAKTIRKRSAQPGRTARPRAAVHRRFAAC